MAKLGVTNPMTFSMLDYSGETKSFVIYSGDLTAVSLPGFLTNFAALKSAIGAATLGRLHKTRYGASEIISNARPSDKNAQVETEMLVTCAGNTSQEPFSFRIPTVDYTQFNYVDDEVILSGSGASAVTIALVEAIVDIARNPNDPTESVIVTGMRVVR